jgi:hypothetical protein
MCTETVSPVAFCGATANRTQSPRISSPQESGYSFTRCARNFENVGSRPALIILDDLLNEVYSQEVCNLFTKFCHHRNVGVILISQICFIRVVIVGTFLLTQNTLC